MMSGTFVWSQNVISGKTQSQSKLILLSFYGTRKDTLEFATPDKTGKFSFSPSETGYYSIVQDSNHIDFIFSEKESCDIEIVSSGDFIINSRENELLDTIKLTYLSYSDKRKNLQKLGSLNPKDSGYVKSLQTKIEELDIFFLSELNRLQKEHPHSFAIQSSSMYIKASVFSNGEDFFNLIEYDKNLLNSTLYPNLFMFYLKNFTQYDEQGFIESVDLILSKTERNEAVYNYSLEFLLNLFDRVGPKMIYDYLIENYLVDGGCDNQNLITSESLKSYRNLRIGNIPDDIELADKNLHEWCGDHDYTIVVFWASFCAHCQEKIPELKKLIDQITNKSIKVISISLDTDQSQYQAFIDGYNWTNICDLKSWKSKYATHFKINKTPSLFLMNKDSEIMSKSFDVEQLKEIILLED